MNRSQAIHTKREIALKQKRIARAEAQKDLLKKVFTTPWRSLDDTEKYLLAILATQENGGYFFTLNLAPKRAKQIQSANNPQRRFDDLLNRALQASGFAGTPYAYVLEKSEKGVTHFHGVILADSNGKRSVTQALLSAGGEIKGHGRARQVQLKKISNTLRLHGYTLKDYKNGENTHLVISKPHLSRSMKGIARSYHADLRSRPDAAPARPKIAPPAS